MIYSILQVYHLNVDKVLYFFGTYMYVLNIELNFFSLKVPLANLPPWLKIMRVQYMHAFIFATVFIEHSWQTMDPYKFEIHSSKEKLSQNYKYAAVPNRQ